MMSQYVDHRLTVFDSASGGNLLTEHCLLAVVVHEWTENKLRPAPRAVDCPARQATRHFLHILLSVTTIDAQSVKLHDLTSVVLVDSRLAFLGLLRLRLLRILIWVAH